MREISAQELKTVAADILFDLDNVCQQLGLRYSIGFGTMIGAVRHQGFIPWDDDIDVIMPREDYNVLISEGHRFFKPNHVVLSINEDKRFGAPLPKIIDTNTVLKQKGHVSEKIEIGIYIDIFILDKIPTDSNLQKKLFKKCMFWQNAWRFSGNAPTINNNVFVKIVRKMLNRTNLSTYYARKLMNVDEITRKYNTELYSILIFKAYSYEKNIQKLDEFENCIEVDFEGGKVKMLGRYDEYLTSIYGDYMVLPPEEKRVTHHVFEAYIR